MSVQAWYASKGRSEMETSKRQEAPDWARTMNAFNTYLSQDLLGGPKVIKLAWVINLHKFLTVFVVALLMISFNNYSTAAWVYIALHGSYGFCWLLKHAVFRDPKWETRVTYGSAVTIFLFLAAYWVAPYLLISDVLGPYRPAPAIGSLHSASPFSPSACCSCLPRIARKNSPSGTGGV